MQDAKNLLGAIRRWLPSSFGRPEARRLARTLTGCALSYGAARLAALPEGYWALITTLVVVTQPSLTQALGTARDQIIGAFIGGIVGMAGVLAIEHGAMPLAVFAVALVPLAALAAERPALRLACVTLVIVVLIPGGTGPYYQRPLHRVLEIMIGAASAFVVAVLFPNRALRNAHQCVADTLRSLGQLIALRLSGNDDASRAWQLEAQSMRAQQALDDALEEARREHIIVPLQSGRADAIDKAAPFLRRLHSDALFLAKAVARDDDPAACAARFQAASQALQEVFTSLADALGSTSTRQADLERARDASHVLNDKLAPPGPGENQHDIARFVVKLIASDLDALIAAIYPPKVRPET
jgi:uncharacterized membrane protein YccC